MKDSGFNSETTMEEKIKETSLWFLKNNRKRKLIPFKNIIIGIISFMIIYQNISIQFKKQLIEPISFEIFFLFKIIFNFDNAINQIFYLLLFILISKIINFIFYHKKYRNSLF